MDTVNIPLYKRFDISAIKSLMKEKSQISFFKDVPQILDQNYKDLLDFLKINPNLVVPDILIQTAGRNQGIFFPKGASESLGRIVFNLGPDDLFRLSRQDHKGRRSFDEYCLLNNTGHFFGEDENDCDILLDKNTKKHLTQFLPNNQTQKIFRIRKLDHMSMVVLITLWVNDSPSATIQPVQVEGPGQYGDETIDDMPVKPLVVSEGPVGRL